MLLNLIFVITDGKPRNTDRLSVSNRKNLIIYTAKGVNKPWGGAYGSQIFRW